MNGFLLVNKEKGMTSFDVVFQLRKKLGIKKIGHTGTLDPDTEGLLVVAVGKATKYINLISDKKVKEYIAIAKLGVHTDTFDSTGKILENRPVQKISDQKILEKLNSFLGKQEQVPPIFSAKKVNGKRLYSYARENLEVKIKKQEIEIFEVNLLRRLNNEEFEFSTTVSKGTYIRSLIVDISKELGTIGTMTNLKRIKTDGFTINDAKKINEIEICDLIKLEDIILENYPKVEVYDKILKLVKNGAMLTKREEITYPCVYVDAESKELIAIYDADDKISKPIFMC